jgi:hypothetical protein
MAPIDETLRRFDLLYQAHAENVLLPCVPSPCRVGVGVAFHASSFGTVSAASQGRTDFPRLGT